MENGRAHKEPEIEVTPAMIEAGVDTLYRFDITEPVRPDMDEAVKAVFLAMLSMHQKRRF